MINLDIEYPIEMDGHEHIMQLKCEYQPEEKPYPTSDHDHPAFADPGESESVSILNGFIQRPTADLMFSRIVLEAIIDEDSLIEHCRDKYEELNEGPEPDDL